MDDAKGRLDHEGVVIGFKLQPLRQGGHVDEERLKISSVQSFAKRLAIRLTGLWKMAEEDGCRRRFLQTRARRWPAMLLRLHLALPDDHANDDERCSVHAIPMHTSTRVVVVTL